MSNKTIDIKLIKSSIGRLPNHKKCVKGLGFRKLQQTVTVEDTQSNRGMINKIIDMLEVKRELIMENSETNNSLGLNTLTSTALLKIESVLEEVLVLELVKQLAEVTKVKNLDQVVQSQEVLRVVRCHYSKGFLNSVFHLE